MTSSALCILALLTWSAMVNARYTPHVHNCSQQETMSLANSVSSHGREDTISRATSNKLANATQKLILREQQGEDRLVQEAVSHQQQRNDSGSQGAVSHQQQRNDRRSLEPLDQQQQGNEGDSQEALSKQRQGNESDSKEALGVRQRVTDRMMLETLRQIRQQLQERDEAFRALRSSLDGVIQQVNEKFAALAQQQTLSSKNGGGGEAEGQSLKDYLGRKLMKLEALLRVSLTSEQSKRVPVMLKKLEAKEKRETAIISQLGEDLCKAAFEGRLEDVRRLFDGGADVQYTSPNCYSPLMSAFTIFKNLTQPNPEVVSLLLERGADVNAVEKNTYYPLTFAAQSSCSRCVALLIAAGADVNARDILGITALHWAARRGSEENVRALLAAGASTTFEAWDGNWKNKKPIDVTESDSVRDLLRV